MSLLRPYLATIKDSFREALASRVLWIMLVLITVALLAVSPLGLRREMTWELNRNSISNGRQLVQRLAAAATAETPSPGKHLWAKLPPKLSGELENATRTELDRSTQFQLRRQLIDSFNQLIQRPDFFDRASWAAVGLGREARTLVDRDAGSLSEAELLRMNRLLLEAAFPDLIRSAGPTTVQLYYFTWESLRVPVTEQQFDMAVNGLLSTFMGFFVGMIGVFVGVLLTASIMPQTLQSGCVELLLSRPISRTLLFLSKFLGACAFIFLNAVYLIVGLWLILGVRLGIWHPRLLLCIPIFLFLFAIYYSVSALAGIIWRSAIVSVVVTVVFWTTCFLLGLGKWAAEKFAIHPERIHGVLVANDILVGVNESGRANRWDQSSGGWVPIFQPEEGQENDGRHAFLQPRITLGPVYESRNDRLAAAAARRRMGPFSFEGAKLWLATRDREFRRVEGTGVPTGTTDLLVDPHGYLLAVSPRGVYRLTGDAQQRPGLKVFDFELPIPVGGGPFAKAGPHPPLAILAPSAVAMDRTNGQLAILTRGELIVCTLDDQGRYHRRWEQEIPGDKQRSTVMAFADNTILLAHDNGWIQVIDATRLAHAESRVGEAPAEPVRGPATGSAGASPSHRAPPAAQPENAQTAVLGQLRPEGDVPIRFVEASPDGSWFAVVFHNGRLHLYDRRQQRLVSRNFAGQGDISAVRFTDDQTILVAHHTNRVTAYNVTNGTRTSQWWPSMPIMERLYRYGLVPLYTIYPKPGRLDETIHYLLTGRKTIGAGQFDMRQAQGKLDPWTPVWSSALFMICVLAVSCVYLRRADL